MTYKFGEYEVCIMKRYGISLESYSVYLYYVPNSRVDSVESAGFTNVTSCLNWAGGAIQRHKNALEKIHAAVKL